jgi:hypothetical protein
MEFYANLCRRKVRKKKGQGRGAVSRCPSLLRGNQILTS